MRPGGLDRRGLGYEACRAVNPRIVFCTISGYGMTGPYKDMPSHGIAYDVWAGLVAPEIDRRRLLLHPRAPVGRHPRRARCSVRSACWPASRALARPASRAGSRSRSPTPPPPWTGSAARPTRPTSGPRPRSPATRPTTTSGVPPAPAGMRDGVRYQFYETADGHVLFMASEREFWENFCAAIDRPRPVRAAPRLAVRRPRPRQHRAARGAGARSSAAARRPSGSSSATMPTRRSRR